MGGKSRKTGGVSKALIDKIKSGDKKSKNCGTKKPKDEPKSLFDDDEKTEGDT